MTIEAWEGPLRYTVMGRGPYALSWPYVAGSVSLHAVDASGRRTVLDPIDWTIAPTASETGGNVTLSPTAAALHEGSELVLYRATPVEQGWQAQLGEREAGMETQLDEMTMALQEAARSAGSALRFDRPVPPMPLILGSVVYIDEQGFPAPGPSVADLVQAGPNAELARKSAEIAVRAASDAQEWSQWVAPSLAALTADSRPYALGAIIMTRAEGQSYEVVSSAPDVITAGGVFLRRRNRGLQAVDTIAALKAVPAARLGTGDLFTVHGFDAPGDGCGGVFRYHSGPAPAQVLDGVMMAASGGGYWLRTDYSGPVHTRWCGIKPEPVPNASFDAGGFAATNRIRWQAMGAFCGRELLPVLVPGKAAAVAGSVFVDAGVHSFREGITLPDCVSLTGAGRGTSILRTGQTTGVFLTVGTIGDYLTTPSAESAFADFSDVSVLSHTDTDATTGLLFANTFRATNIHHIFARGFGTNLHVDAFGLNIDNIWLQSGAWQNLRIGPRCNSFDIQGSRLDDQRLNGGDNVLIEEAGFARSVRLHRCDIQRSYGRALRFVGVADALIQGCFFEGNNRGGSSSPDIWIEGAGVRQFQIDQCYFTGTGRNNSTDSRAINIREDVTAGARFQISNCQQASSAQGSFDYFIDVDADVAMEIAAWNNIHTAPNAIPAAVIRRGLAAGSW